MLKRIAFQREKIMENVSNNPSPGFLAGAMKGVTWILGLAVGITAFLAPALWNGFALVFFDTGGYVRRVLEMGLYPGRSFFYGLFLWTSSLGWWSFWGPVLVQSLCCLWVIYLMLRCHDLPSGPFATAIFCVGLGLSTGISWYASQMMPDVLVPLVVIALWLLGFCWYKINWRERAGLMVLALLGLMSHMSCMALAIGLAGCILVARVVVHWKGWPLSVCSLPPVAVVAASLILMPMLHLAVLGKATYTPGGPAYIFGRLVQEGIAQRWLADHCPVSGIRLCGMQDRIPKIADDFLWSKKSPFRDIGGWSGAADTEMSYLIGECLRMYPGAVIWSSFRATFQQMAMVATGDGIDEFQGDTRVVFNRLPHGTAKLFNAAYQQQGRITQPIFDALNHVHIPAAYLSLLGLLLVIGWGLRVKRQDLVGVAFFTLLAFLGNAFICGALSSPHDRYQSRLAWLAAFVVGMTTVCWWQYRTRRKATSPHIGNGLMGL
jgi:hypothetical protein